MTSPVELPAGVDSYLRFADQYADPIVDREKCGTIRYGFDRDLRQGDVVALIDEHDRRFAIATIGLSARVDLRNFVELPFEIRGLEYDDVDDVIDSLREHYDEPPEGFDETTYVTVLTFVVTDPPTGPKPVLPSRQCDFDGCSRRAIVVNTDGAKGCSAQHLLGLEHGTLEGAP